MTQITTSDRLKTKTTCKRQKKIRCKSLFIFLRWIMQIIGIILIVFAIADFGLSYMGINLTPFLPPEISRFSPIAIGLLGGFLLNIGNKKWFKIYEKII